MDVHCVIAGSRRHLLLVRRWPLRYAEDRDAPVSGGDLDLGDEGLDQSLALAVAAGCDNVGDVIGDLPQGGSWRRGGCCGDLVGEFITTPAQLS